jgi:hypothetical protein
MSLQCKCFERNLAYFVTVVNYSRKMFKVSSVVSTSIVENDCRKKMKYHSKFGNKFFFRKKCFKKFLLQSFKNFAPKQLRPALFNFLKLLFIFAQAQE